MVNLTLYWYQVLFTLISRFSLSKDFCWVRSRGTSSCLLPNRTIAHVRQFRWKWLLFHLSTRLSKDKRVVLNTFFKLIPASEHHVTRPNRERERAGLETTLIYFKTKMIACEVRIKKHFTYQINELTVRNSKVHHNSIRLVKQWSCLNIIARKNISHQLVFVVRVIPPSVTTWNFSQ